MLLLSFVLGLICEISFQYKFLKKITTLVIVVTCVRSDVLYDYSDVTHRGSEVDRDPGNDSPQYVSHIVCQ